MRASLVTEPVGRQDAGELVEQQRRPRRRCRAAPRSRPARSAARRRGRRSRAAAATRGAEPVVARGQHDHPARAQPADRLGAREDGARGLADPAEPQRAPARPGSAPSRRPARATGSVEHDQRVGVADAVPTPALPAVELGEPAAHVRQAGEPGQRVLAGELVQVGQRRLAPAARARARCRRGPGSAPRTMRYVVAQPVQGLLEGDPVPRQVAARRRRTRRRSPIPRQGPPPPPRSAAAGLPVASGQPPSLPRDRPRRRRALASRRSPRLLPSPVTGRALRRVERARRRAMTRIPGTRDFLADARAT